ncbi:hypothetical protein ACKLNO_04245 [Neisseriaceae bacterium B1]
MFKPIVCSFITLALFSGSLNAKTIEIEDELCLYHAKIDEKKYSEQQFRDTMEMLLRYNAFVASVDHRHSETEIRQAYAKNIQQLHNFKLLPHPIFDTARQQMLAKGEFLRDLTLTESRAVHQHNPKILQQFQPQLAQCQILANQVSPAELQAAANKYIFIREAPNLVQWHKCVNSVQPDVAVHTDDKKNGVVAARKAYFLFAQGKAKKIECDEP